MEREKIYKKSFNFFKHNLEGRVGFSLVETIIYLAIVGILLVAVLNFHFSLSGTSAKLWAKINVSENRRFVLQTIDYLSRNSTGLLKDVNGDCTTSSALSFYFDDDTYLPGTCVSSGGGVKITSESNRVKLTCYPNITNNGQYNACDATAGNSYWLSSPEVSLATNGLFFATSTATSTAGTFMNVEANLTLINISNNQTELLATSTATSTITLKNQQADALVAWWRLNDAGNAATDSKNNYDAATCRGLSSQQTALVNASVYAVDFENDSGANCAIDDATGLNLSGQFTLSAWAKIESFAVAENDYLISKQNTGVYQGYAMWVRDNYLFCGICDNSSCVEKSEDTAPLATGSTYNFACTYNPDIDQMKLYVFQEGVGGFGTTTSAITENLVNSSATLYLAAYGAANYFDGLIDEVRIYSRALADQEIWALQSQGATAN